MVKTLLLSHGQLAFGMHDALSMIAGNKALDYLGLTKDMSVASFEQKLRDKLTEMKTAEQIIIAVDLKGGSPYTSAVSILEEMDLLHKSYLISGLNLGLALQLALSRGVLPKEELEKIVTRSQESIEIYKSS